ncbi:MAG: aminoacyl-tRNA hydrolase [Sedimentisphaerales bacterium]|nr:aminoacyl-tRNA hydrolase [Sedimentisphaerales bacterium]
MSLAMKMIVGLGNPGSEYADTRHNIGFEVVDALSEWFGIKVKKRKFEARIGETEFEGKKLILVKPWKYMNRSGQAVATAAGFYKLPIPDLLVVTDDMALESGRIRIRAKGSAGGHNGLKDIIEKLGTEDFARLRVGIGQATESEAYDYVLSKVPAEQKEPIDSAIERARDAVICWLRNGIEATMNEYNKTVDE